MHHIVPYGRDGAHGQSDLANYIPACNANGHHDDLDHRRLVIRRKPDGTTDIHTAQGRHVGTRPPPSVWRNTSPPAPHGHPPPKLFDLAT